MESVFTLAPKCSLPLAASSAALSSAPLSDSHSGRVVALRGGARARRGGAGVRGGEEDEEEAGRCSAHQGQGIQEARRRSDCAGGCEGAGQAQEAAVGVHAFLAFRSHAGAVGRQEGLRSPARGVDRDGREGLGDVVAADSGISMPHAAALQPN